MGVLRSAFRRKPIQELDVEEREGAFRGGAGSDGEVGLKRSLGAWDLIFLAIGAVIGAGIFGAIGTAAAGEMRDGAVVRYGAGPGLVLSFVLLGVVCSLAALCYAELAAMIPHAGSAYAYTYATLGEVVAWIIGWDLILEYAVGNVAVAISWSNYLNTLLGALGIPLPGWIAHGYYDIVQQAGAGDAAAAALLREAPQVLGVPIIVNLPAVFIVTVVTMLLVQGAKESARANAIMVVVKLLVLTLFIGVGMGRVDPTNYSPFLPNGFTGVWQGAAVVFFAYIGFDAISTAAEETRDPQRNVPLGILGGLAICTVVYVAVGTVLVGLAPWSELGRHGDPLAYALEHVGLPVAGWIVALGAVIAYTSVLLVFQYGQPRILLAMARDGLLPEAAAKVSPKTRTPVFLTVATGVVVGLGALVADDDATYDLTNIGTLFAFFLVCVGVLVLRVTQPGRARPFRVPAVWLVAPLGAVACVFVMAGLPAMAWERFVIWLGIGLVVYAGYGFRASRLSPL